MQLNKNEKISEYFAVLFFVVLFIGFLLPNFSFASTDSGVLHPDGVGSNGVYEAGPPLSVQFKLINAVQTGQFIDLTFPDEVGSIDIVSIQVFQDSDSTPCDGASVNFTASLIDRLVSIEIHEPILANSTICIKSFQLAIPAPHSQFMIFVRTKTGVRLTNFGVAFHTGSGAQGGIPVQAEVVDVIQFTLSGTEIGFGQLGVTNRLDFGPGAASSGTTLSFTSNASNGVSVSVQLSQSLKNSLNYVIPDWNDDSGFGITAQSNSTGMIVASIYTYGSTPAGVPVIPNLNALAASSGMVQNVSIDIAYHIRPPLNTYNGLYSTQLSLIISPNF